MSDVLDRPAPPSDHRVAYGTDPNQFGDLRLPAGSGPHPVVVGIHGGFWRKQYDLAHFSHLCAALTKVGFATWNLEYRRIGQKGGGFPGTMQDVALGTDFLPKLAKSHPLTLDRVVAIGHSAGGQLALWLGGRQHIDTSSPLHVEHPFRLHAIVGLAAISDLAQASSLRLGDGIVDQFMGGNPQAVPTHYAAASPIELLPLGLPQKLIHGAEDDVVPITMSENYCRAARARGDDAVFQALPRMGHYELIDPTSKAWNAVQSAVQSLSRA
jgi:acetyl esterase/lipase